MLFLVTTIHHNAVRYEPPAQDSLICLACSFLFYKVLHFYYTKRQCKSNKNNSFEHIVVTLIQNKLYFNHIRKDI